MKYLFFLIIFLNVFFNKTIYSAESYVVLKVNNNIITNVDINTEYRYLIALNKDLKEIDKKKIMKIAKDSMIREKIKESELINYFDLNQPNKHIDQIVKNFYIRLGIKNETEFKNYLSNYNLLFEIQKTSLFQGFHPHTF